MPIITLRQIEYSVGPQPLLDQVDFIVEPKERVALVGRNGQGKSTLMKIIAGHLQAEAGDVQKHPTTSVALLSQSLPPGDDQTVYQVVSSGLKELSAALNHYHELIHQDTHDEAWMNALNEEQEKIENLGGWAVHQKIEKALQELELPEDALMKSLSGGWRRKVALAQAFVQEPDLLLLDEPTNHLDLEAIAWLEKRLYHYPKTLMFITHDRALMRHLATRIVDLDRGHISSYPGDYDVYLDRKAKDLQDEEKANQLFDKQLADEEKWIRQGIKARRTRNEGRVRALKELREQRKLRRVRQDKATFEAHEVTKHGKTVIQAHEISFSYDSNKKIVDNFSFTIQRGDKIAVVGSNGAGKTTLIQLLLDKLKPDSGWVKHSPTNKIAFFDQTRESLNPELSLIDNVAEGDDFIEFDGKRKHVIGYLGDFLFSPKKCQQIAKTLSGGEQNRLMLARLFARPANLYVLDEPTNDLDIETLEILETFLLNTKSTVIVISHDREFIDNIATHTLGVEPGGHVSVHVGGYSDWVQRKSEAQPKAVKTAAAVSESKTKNKSSKKLSYNEQRELDKLPETIETLELKISKLEAKMNEEGFYQLEQALVKKVNEEHQDLHSQLEAAVERWQELESKLGD